MSIFDGRYRWDGTKTGEQDPIAWSPGAYDVKIFKFSASSQKVQHLKSHICIYASTGDGQSISANPEKFAKQICYDFSLDLERVLWVEDLLKDEDRYEVITFTKSTKVGDTIFYKTAKRLALKSEVANIHQELSGVDELFG